MNRLTIRSEYDGNGESLRGQTAIETTNAPESEVLSLTSNSGYSDVYSDIYTGPSSFAVDSRIVLVVPSETNTNPVYLSATSTEWGVRLSSRGVSVLHLNSSKLYLATTGSTDTEVTILAI